MTEISGPLSVGIVGCGRIARAHAKGYRLLADQDVHVVAVADVDEQRATSFASEYTDGARVFSSLSAMIDACPGLDAISVCTPNRYHHDVVLYALAAGKHVLCEKPPAMTVGQAREMAAAAEQSDGLLTYGMVYRHILPEAADFARELGPIYFARASWTRARGVPGWVDYGSSVLHGGGAMTDLGVHLVDLAWVLMGRPEPRRVVAHTWNHKARTATVGLLGDWDRNRFAVEDHGVAIVGFDDAALVLEAAFATDLDSERTEIAQVQLQGVHGRLVVPLMTTQTAPDPDAAMRLWGQERHGHLVSSVIGPPLPLTVRSGYERELAHFVDCCRGLAEPLVTPADGVASQLMLDGINLSARRGGEQVEL